MKSIKLSLAVLMLFAIFTACSKEEIASQQEVPVPNEEFVGAELLGTNISVDFGRDADTKYNEGWEKTDKLGLGWLLEGTTKVDAVQTGTVKVTNSKLYANHLFQLRDNDDFTTYGNVYVGWHFGYYPFAYMPQNGQPMKVEINPAQTELYNVDVYKTRLFLSAREFLTVNHLDENYQLKEGVEFAMKRAVKLIKVNVNPNDTFTGQDVLKGLKIKSLKLTTDKEVFESGVKDTDGKYKVEAKLANLATMAKDPETGEYDPETTEENLFASFEKVLVNSKNSKTVTTVINNESIDLSESQALRVYVLPATETLDATKCKINVAVEGGEFLVKWTKNAEENTPEATNNAALTELAEAYDNEGILSTSANGLAGIELDIILTADMFTPNFKNIDSEETWNAAVTVADALNQAPTFTIKQPANEANWWGFEDVDGDGNLINLPKNKLTVVGGAMLLNAEGEWPAKAKMDAESVAVVVNAELNVADDMKVASIEVNADMNVAKTLNAASIVNNATIFAGPTASISNDSGKTLDNTNGEVIAAFGAYVFPTLIKEGTIAYVVEDAAPAEILKINTMLTHEKTSVNTLIVKTELDLNAVINSQSTESDRYTSTTIPWSGLTSLSDVNVILENGSLVHNVTGASATNTTVKHLVARSGENTIDDVVVTEDIHIAEGAILNVNNTAANDAKTYSVVAIYNEGTLNSNVEFLNVYDLDNSKGKIDVVDNKCIIWENSYIQGGSVDGWVVEKMTADKAKSGADYEFDGLNNYTIKTAKGLVYLAESLNTTDAVTIVLANDIDMKGIYWTGIIADQYSTFDGNNKTIKNLSGNSGLFKGNTKINIKNLTIEDVRLYTNNKYAGAVAANNYGLLSNITVKNVTITGLVNDGSYGAISGAYNRSMGSESIENCIVDNAIVKGGKRAAGIAALVNVAEEPGNTEIKNCVVKNSSFSNSTYAGAVKGAYAGEINGNNNKVTFKNCSYENTTPAVAYGKASNVTVK